MRGTVFLMFEAYVVERRGHDAFEDVLDAVAGRLITSDPFIGPMTYPDEDLLTLVDAEAVTERMTRGELLYDLGAFGFARLIRRYQWMVAGHRSLSAFLAHVRRAVGDSTQLELEIGPPLRVAYASPPMLCALVEGLLVGAGRYFKSPLQLAQHACVDRGDPSCVWEGLAA